MGLPDKDDYGVKLWMKTLAEMVPDLPPDNREDCARLLAAAPSSVEEFADHTLFRSGGMGLIRLTDNLDLLEEYRLIHADIDEDGGGNLKVRRTRLAEAFAARVAESDAEGYAAHLAAQPAPQSAETTP